MVSTRRGQLIGLVVFLASLVIGALSLRDPFKMQSYMEQWTYPIMTLSFLILAYALSPWVKRARTTTWNLRGRAAKSALAGALFTLAFFVSIEPAFKLFADESNLLTTSEAFYRFKTAKIISGQLVDHGNATVVETLIPKQPYLFSYTLSLLHNLRGYSINNGFLLNGILCAVFTSLLFYVFIPWGLTCALGAILLFFATPITAMTVTSSDFTFLFFVMIFALTMVLARLREAWSQDVFLLFWILSVLTVHTRYEAIGLVGLLWVYAVATKIFRWRELRTNLLPLGSSLLLLFPFLWQQGIYWTRFGGGHTEYNGIYKTELFGTFSHRYWWPNLKMFADTTMNIFSNQPFTPHLFLIGMAAIAVYYFRRANTVERSADFGRLNFHFTTLLALCLVHFGILMTYFFGEAGYPSTARYFMGLCSFVSIWPVLLLVKMGAQRYRGLVFSFCFISFLYVHSYAQSSPYRNNIYQVKTFYWFRDHHLSLLNDKAIMVHDYSVNLIMLHKSVVSSHVFGLSWKDFRTHLASGRYEKLFTLEVVDPGKEVLSRLSPELRTTLEHKIIDATDLGLGVKAVLMELSFKPAALAP